ncbi:uncharacterized protein LOC135834124 [Planococcus citri]|uniref:uncharacterized protein LOC135834124 n=1 Tax=Planococcus citri TaxID=170843 RepID=UPI0031FA310D
MGNIWSNCLSVCRQYCCGSDPSNEEIGLIDDPSSFSTPQSASTSAGIMSPLSLSASFASPVYMPPTPSFSGDGDSGYISPIVEHPTINRLYMHVLYMPELPEGNVSNKENIAPVSANPSELTNAVSSNRLSRIRYDRAKKERVQKIIQTYLRFDNEDSTDEDVNENEK